MTNILITGGSGLIGQHLTRALQRDAHTVRWLSRTQGEKGDVKVFSWNIARGEVDGRALEGVDHIVHLSGAGIADKRWTKARLHELLESRADAARLLLRKAKEIGCVPKSFVSASGAGFYGAITSDHIFSEEDPAASDTIGQLTKAWEDGVDEWDMTTIPSGGRVRVVKLRTSMVIAKNGGALPRLAAPARWGLAAAFGGGKQWMPWVHIDDLVRVYQQAITDERMRGAFNVCATEQPTNEEFMRAVAKALRKPFFLPNIPAFALRIALGELSHVILDGSRTSGQKLLETGFRFRHDVLRDALAEALQ